MRSSGGGRTTRMTGSSRYDCPRYSCRSNAGVSIMDDSSDCCYPFFQIITVCTQIVKTRTTLETKTNLAS